MKRILSNTDVQYLARVLAEKIQRQFPDHLCVKLFPVPRGGVPVTYLLGTLAGYRIVDNAADADVIIDDIIDTGATRDKYAAREETRGIPFFALVDKHFTFKDDWVVFPWENNEDKDDSFADNITRLLQFIGEDSTRGGLLETPRRVAKAWEEWTSGYAQDPVSILKCFEDGSENYDQIILVKDIPFFSHCEHHLAPFFGTAHVGYIPNGRIVGLSKLPALVDVYAKRLQVQERLTNQIADALWTTLSPKAVGVVINARHLCMESRGKKKIGSSTTTSALRGTLLTEPDCRAEFFSLIKL